MTRVVFIAPDGTRRDLDLQNGLTLMQGAVQNNVHEIVAECGGSCTCATCHVYIAPDDDARLPPASEIENDMLDCVVAERRPTSRLSCQIMVTSAIDGLTVHLPERQV